MNLDPQRAKELLAKLVKDVRGNRVWLLALVLLVAIVAVPIALSKSASGTPIAALPQAPPPATGAALAALNVQSSHSGSRLPGRGRDPFAGQGSTKSKTTTTTATTTTSGSTGTQGAAATSTTPSASTSAPPTSTTSAPPTITPGTKPKPVPSGLTSTESYDVTLAITNASGGLDTINPLVRLTILPSEQQPLLVELGVLKGGHRVLFALQPGTAVNGPGTCTPGPIDCEILSLGQDQTEGLSAQSPSAATRVALFAVTAITAGEHPSASAAQKARREESAAGRRLLDASTLNALSLFQYQPSVGAVVDLSNLTARDP